MTRRTGAAATRTVDNFTAYRFAVVLLVLAVAGGAVGSVEGLLHAGSWAEPSYLQWTLPVAVDVFLVGTALATLMLRERRAYWAAGLCALVTLALVAFSASVNYAYVLSITEPGTVEHAWGPWIKGSMPVLLLAALEIIAALTSTRNNRANSPLNREKAKVKKLQRELRELKDASKPPRQSRAEQKADRPSRSEQKTDESWPIGLLQVRPPVFEGQVFPPEPIGSREP
jgi:hypothetical protein